MVRGGIDPFIFGYTAAGERYPSTTVCTQVVTLRYAFDLQMLLTCKGSHYLRLVSCAQIKTGCTALHTIKF